MTTEFEFDLDTTDATQSTGGGNVDWEAMHEYIVETAGTQNKKRSLVAVIAGIYDLGIQERGEFKEPYVKGSDKHEKALKDFGAYFEECTWGKDKGKTLICIPQRPVKCINFAIDFPQVQIDLAPFFGRDPEPTKPLRLLLGGEFYIQEIGMTCRGFPVTETKHEKENDWGFSKNSVIHRLGEATDQLEDNGLFKKEKLGRLVGKTAQFEMQVHMKESKNGKTYFTETIKLAGMVPEGMNIPSFDASILHGVNMYPAVNGVTPEKSNNPEVIKILRKSVKNTMARALNFEGSVLEAELAASNTPDSNTNNSGSSTPSTDDDDDMLNTDDNTTDTSDVGGSSGAGDDSDLISGAMNEEVIPDETDEDLKAMEAKSQKALEADSTDDDLEDDDEDAELKAMMEALEKKKAEKAAKKAKAAKEAKAIKAAEDAADAEAEAAKKKAEAKAKKKAELAAQLAAMEEDEDDDDEPLDPSAMPSDPEVEDEEDECPF